MGRRVSLRMLGSNIVVVAMGEGVQVLNCIYLTPQGLICANDHPAYEKLVSLIIRIELEQIAGLNGRILYGWWCTMYLRCHEHSPFTHIRCRS